MLWVRTEFETRQAIRRQAIGRCQSLEVPCNRKKTPPAVELDLREVIPTPEAAASSVPRSRSHLDTMCEAPTESIGTRQNHHSNRLLTCEGSARPGELRRSSEIRPNACRDQGEYVPGPFAWRRGRADRVRRARCRRDRSEIRSRAWSNGLAPAVTRGCQGRKMGRGTPRRSGGGMHRQAARVQEHMRGAASCRPHVGVVRADRCPSRPLAKPQC